MESMQTTKIPVLKPGEFEIWKMRIKQYMSLTDYTLWEAVVNGVKETKDADGKIVAAPDTEAARKQKTVDMKALSTLLVGIPNEYQTAFASYTDPKLLYAAIETRFGGNDNTKEVEKSILKQEYENFKGVSTETLQETFDRFQKLVGNLEMHKVNMEPREVITKFLRSLSPEWNPYTIPMRQRKDLGSSSLEEIYNDLRCFASDVEGEKKTAVPNAAFLSIDGVEYPGSSKPKTSIVDETIFEALIVSQSDLTNDDLKQLNPDDLEEMDLKWQMAMIIMKTKNFYNRTGRNKFQMKRNDRAGFDRSKVECYNCHKLGHFARECRNPKVEAGSQGNGSRSQEGWNNNNRRNTEAPSNALVSLDGGGYDWSDQADSMFNYALMATTLPEPSDSEVPHEFKSKLCTPDCLKTVVHYRKYNSDILDELKAWDAKSRSYIASINSLEEQIKHHKKNELDYDYQVKYAIWESNVKEAKIVELTEKLEKITKERDSITLSVNGLENASKSIQNLIQSQIHDKLKVGLGYNTVPPPFNGMFMPPKLDIDLDKLKETMPELNLSLDPSTSSEEEQFNTPASLSSETSSWNSSDDDVKKTVKTETLVEIPEIVHQKELNIETVKILKRPVVTKSRSGIGFVKQGNKITKVEQPKVESCANCVNCQKQAQKKPVTVRGNQRNWNQQMSNKLGSDWKMVREKYCFICGKTGHTQDLCYHNKNNEKARNDKHAWTNIDRVNKQNFKAKSSFSTFKRNCATSGMINNAYTLRFYGQKPKTAVTKVNIVSSKVSTVFKPKAVLTKVNTASGKVSTGFKTKAVETTDTTVNGSFLKYNRYKSLDKFKHDISFHNKLAYAKRIQKNALFGTGKHFPAVKSSVHWEWRPKSCTNDSMTNSASMIRKKVDYFDAQGKLKSTLAWVPKRD